MCVCACACRRPFFFFHHTLRFCFCFPPPIAPAHAPAITHQVHERSVDTDLLCLFAKRLMETHPTLRLIVMSATLSADLLTKYYGLELSPLFVGVRRFPVR